MKKLKNLLGGFVLLMLTLLFVPEGVKAVEMSDEFKSYLNEQGMFEFNSNIPTNDDHFALLVDLNTYDEEFNWNGLSFSNVADDYSEVDLTINSDDDNKKETHRVKLYYDYDKKAETKIKNFVNTVIENKTVFEVADLELVNYYYNRIKNGYNAELTMFSGELKEALNYGNLEFEVSVRGGSSAPLKKETIGFGYFIYDGSIYHVINPFGTTADHIIYVPSETENTKDALVAAAQKRIDDYLGETDVQVSYLSTAWEYWVSYFYEYMSDVWVLDDPELTLEQFEQLGNVYMPAYPSFEEGFEDVFGLSGIAEDDLMATIDVPIDENMGDSFDVFIKRDSSKMVTPISKTTDLSTDIEISTNATLPLDTIIQAKELTSGAEYERILKTLDLTDNLIFDLKLYSNSLDKYITKLDDGTFEVKIPVPNDFKGKDLVVYYVKENGEKEEYKVDVKDEYAVFKTTHFSIYTLGYIENIGSGNGAPLPEENPKTFDGVDGSILMTIMSLIGLVSVILYSKKEIL